MDPNPIVITGAEVVTCLGASREATWRAVAEGRCGMGPLTAMESSLPPGAVGGQAVDLPPDYEPQAPREVRYLKWTIERALADAAALEKLPYEPSRCGLMLGTTLHGMRSAGQFLRSGNPSFLRDFPAGSTLESAAAGLALSGFAATTCSACSSSLGSVALACTLLQSGQLDLVVCGGYDTISEYVYGGFNSLRLVAEGPLRPFAKGRQGMKLAEGYGILVLERAGEARRRGAKALAQVLGWGESADAHHLTQPHPEGDGAARAMDMALRAAKLTPRDVDLVAAHATGTPDNDAAEYAALRRTFGDDLPRVPVVAFKSHLGHTLGGAGAVELVLAMMAMGEELIPPCANVAPGDLEFPDLSLSMGSAKRARIRATLNTSLGFGGANTSVILGPAPQEAQACHIAADEPHREVLITGVGVVAPGAVGNEAFIAKLAADGPASWEADTGAIPEEQFIHLLNVRRVRRMSDYVKLVLAATAIACQDAHIQDVPLFARDCCAILGTMHGSVQYSCAYYGEIVKQGLIGANPMLFAEGVPNAGSAHLSLMLSVKGACQTIIGTRTAGLDALRLASLRIASGVWDRAIVVAGEEYCQGVNDAYRDCGLYVGRGGNAPFAGQSGFVTGSAAAAFILESRSSMDSRGGVARGRMLDAASSRGQAADPTWAAQQVLKQLGSPKHVISSANGTWVDRAELAALRRCCPGATVSAVYGHVAESLSAGPLLALAGPLLSGRMMRLRGSALPGGDGLTAATGEEMIDSVTSLCTDYTGSVSAVRIAPGDAGRLGR